MSALPSGRIVIFSGPTLSADEGRREVPELADASWRPPVAQGDLYLAARERPWGIGIVDGYFDRLASVWHKEILWALSEGVHVFGAASLGALRAMECAPFGMVGVGKIYAAFASGELTDDDEVTVFHGPAATGYAAGSEAMVNLRATFAAAAAAGVIGEPTRGALVAIAKALLYPERGMALVLEQARRAGLPAFELAALAAWLPTGRVDQKKLDALAMLSRMAARRVEHPGRFEATFPFQRTEAWEAGRIAADQRTALAAGEGSEIDPLDELRLGGLALGGEETAREGDRPAAQAAQTAKTAAQARVLALALADHGGLRFEDSARDHALARFRHKHGLDDEERLAAFLAEQRLDTSDLARLASDEARIERVLPLIEPLIDGALRDDLRVRRAYAPLAERAEAKARALAARGLSQPGVADTGLALPDLWRWFFADRLGRPVPADSSALERAARDLGFSGTDQLRRAVVREALFVRG
ncbi:MAG TPA: TfuA-like protein [Thermoanaerobaculia bacterium]|jgi:hypothetical protein|nr:TfuA-like protein [Thermoanaerobaculia bacterium]